MTKQQKLKLVKACGVSSKYANMICQLAARFEQLGIPPDVDPSVLRHLYEGNLMVIRRYGNTKSVSTYKTRDSKP